MQHLLLLTLLQSCCCACREVFSVDGWSTSTSRGIFVSENFPHSLPIKSNCIYEFKFVFRSESDAFCIEFKDLQFYSANKTTITFGMLSQTNSFLLTYAGNGSLLSERDAGMFIIVRPESLYSGPVCLRTSKTISSYFVEVHNLEIFQPTLDRVTQFFAEYTVEDSRKLKPQKNESSHIGHHRCLDGSRINRSKRCDSINDCSQSNPSDFFDGMSSDESYEYARCYSANNFGTNFALGKIGVHTLLNEGAWVDFSVDHSNHFSRYPDVRDSSLRVQHLRSIGWSHKEQPSLRLSGFKEAVNTRTATCYRFYWKANGYRTEGGALALAESHGGRVLLRLPAYWSQSCWSMAEVQLEPGFSSSWVDVYTVHSEQWNQTTGAHWLDDLSAEPAACDKSAYESRIPSVCSFEWSTCGWETINLSVVTVESIASEFRVISFFDHTSSSVPDRGVQPQRMLRLHSGTEDAILVPARRLTFSNSRCFDVWFYGLGSSGFSFRVNFQISGTQKAVVLTATVPTNQWNRISGSVLYDAHSSFTSLVVVIRAYRWDKLKAVLLDDLSVTDGECSNDVNGTVHCGSLEWRCSNGHQCIMSTQVCDGHRDCSDSSDEVNCIEGGSNGQDQYWALVIRVLLGFFVISVAFVALSICLRKRWGRRARTRAADHRSTSTVSDGRLPLHLSSDRTLRRPDMPPSYEEVAAGTSNSGFAVDEEPPKYDDMIQAMQNQEQQH